MNVSSILSQLARQASGQTGNQRAPGEGGGGSVLDTIKSQATAGGVDIKSLLGGGALGLLVGSKRGRKMGGKALKYSALAGVGVLAWKAWQNYQDGAGASSRPSSAPAPESQGRPLEQLQGAAEEQRGLEILQAMIMAARADGHIDAAERALLTTEIEKLGADDELQRWIQNQFDAPLDAEALARSADSPQAAREIYLVSAVIVDEQNPMERAWLDQLSAALKLPRELTQELDRQVAGAA